jgi:hypothetical protein
MFYFAMSVLLLYGLGFFLYEKILEHRAKRNVSH